MQRLWTRFKKNLPLLAILLTTGLAIAPVLHSGYFGDDGLNSLTGAYLRHDNINLFQLMRRIMGEWYYGNGRFYPFAAYVYPLFLICPSLVIYKIGTVVAVLITLLAFGRLIREFCPDRGLPLLAMFFPCLLLQFRAYHDPILSFHYLLQFVLFQTLLSLFYFYRYQKTGRSGFLFTSAFFYATSLLTYEISYTFFILHAIIAWAAGSGRRRAIMGLIPFVLLAGAATCFAIYLRAHAAGLDPNYRPNHDPATYVHALGIQVAASLPLIYYGCDPSALGIHSWSVFADNIDSVLVVSSIGVGLVFYLVLQAVKLPSRRAIFGLLVFGLALTIAPALLISLSPKYQTATLGLGYIQVYLEYFGVATLLAVTCASAYSVIRHATARCIFRILLSVACAGVFAINLVSNRVVVETSNKILLYPRDIFGQSLRHGLLESVPEGSTIVIDGAIFWNSPYFVFSETGRRFKVVELRDYYAELAAKPASSIYEIRSVAEQNVYFVRYAASSFRHGYVFCGKGRSVVLDHSTKTAAQIWLTDLTTFADVGTSHKVVYADVLRHDISIGPKILSVLSPGPAVRGDHFQIARRTLTGETADFFSLNCVETSSAPPDNSDFRVDSDSPNLFSAEDYRSAIFRVGRRAFIREATTGNLVGIEDESLSQRTTAPQEVQSCAFRYAPHVESDHGFSVELILRAASTQPANAAIIGNHPGIHQFEGFVIQREGEHENRYVFATGTGHSWQPPVPFSLPPEEWHYVACNVHNNTAAVYLDGAFAGSVHYTAPCASSELPLIIGNWINGGRAFRGFIQEVALGHGDLDEARVKSTWKIVHQRLVEQKQFRDK